MTKAEFTSKMRKLSYCDDLGRLALFSEYVESLEAENERLTKAVEKAVQKLMNACPTDAYPCPIQLERESLYKRCDRCWRQFLMGDE